MKPKKVVITGAHGFIGSNLAISWLACNPFPGELILLDGMTYAARPEFFRSKVLDLPSLVKWREETFDIRDHLSVARFMQREKPDLIFHLAAESHVCRSISGPQAFMETNIMGTFNLIEEFRQLWGDSPEARFVHVSTDEVFGELLPLQYPFTEKSQINPRSPYAASKASSDHIVSSYVHTYGVNAIITNCSNNFGPNQHEEKLIPATIKAILLQKPAMIFGDGKQVRDWIWVGDHVWGLMTLAREGEKGERYCLGGENEMTNKAVMSCVHASVNRVTGKAFEFYGIHTNSRPTDDRRYAINCDKAKETGWKPMKPSQFSEKLDETVEYYLREYNWADLVRASEAKNAGVVHAGS